MKAIRWQTGDRREVVVVVEVVGRTSDHGNALAGHEVSLRAEVAGVTVGYWLETPNEAMASVGCVARIGNLGIRADNAAAIRAALAEAEADPRVVETKMRIAAGERVRMEHEQHVARVERAMAE